MRAPFRRLLCPTDFSAVGNAAFAVARALAAPGATLHLVHVREPAYVMAPLDAAPVLVLPPTSPKAQVAADRRALARLERLAGRAAGRVRVRPHVLLGPGAAAEILRLARAQRVQAIVVGTKGRGGLGKLLLGSVASAVARDSSVPVVLVQPARRKRGR